MQFSHSDHNEQYLSLHDCIAERACFENGILGFAFPDGFWISPDHPESDLSEMVRTDFSMVEFSLENGKEYDVAVYVFTKTLFGKTVREEWSVPQLVNSINRGKCRLEFLYQYIDWNSRIVECELIFDKKPYRKECLLKISAQQVNYLWNHLRKDCPW